MLTVITPARSFNLTTLGTVRTELGLVDRDEDASLAGYIRQASGIISEYCGRVFAEETVSEVFRLDRQQGDLILERYPVSEIISVVENGVTLQAADYEVNAANGILTRLSSDAPTLWALGKIVVQHRAGHRLLDSLPWGVERAAIILVKTYRAAGDRDPLVRSESVPNVGDQSFFSTPGALPSEVVGLLTPHRNRRLR